MVRRAKQSFAQSSCNSCLPCVCTITYQGFVRDHIYEFETPEQLRRLLNQKFMPKTRRTEPTREAFKLDVIRDWKSYLACLGRKITGIAGPDAPHHFEFVRRSCHVAQLGLAMLGTMDPAVCLSNVCISGLDQDDPLRNVGAASDCLLLLLGSLI